MGRVISSAQTFFSKFIIPLVLVCGIGFALLGNGFSPIMIPLLGILSLTVYWFLGRLKKVTVDADGLVISNYFRDVKIPWRHIIHVSGSGWTNTRQITITFDRDIGFGTSIIFMPKFRYLWPGQESPTAQELRDLIRENRRS